MIVLCPACGWETKEHEPDWIADREVVRELCEECHRELHGDDETRYP